MDKQAAVKIIRDTFENPFNRTQFVHFARNLLNKIDESKAFHARGYIPEIFKDYVKTYERVGTFTDPENDKVDVLIVYLQRETSLEHARSSQRNFVARYLKDRGEKEASLVAFVSPDGRDWRFSLVRMDYNIVESSSGKIKVETELTPARRYSFLVGENESSHTAQSQLVDILADDKNNPTLSTLEGAFNIEVATKEFFDRYRELFHKVTEELDKLVARDKIISQEFEDKEMDTVNFAKKLLGQIVFLYFLQKKGWLGVPENRNWGGGDKKFLRNLFEKCRQEKRNFFNDYLEYLFYDALNNKDRGRIDPSYYQRFGCRIPFLNGGLFDSDYDWFKTDIIIPDAVFSNRKSTNDEGSGILDIFDLYNFTVKEDEPLDKEVAIDPEMLGKVFENLLEVKDRKSKGTYYTPREIVHYMCQESLINYLDTAVNTGDVPLVQTSPPQGKLFGKPDPEQTTFKTPSYRVLVPREDIEAFVRKGELAIEHDTRVESYGKETERYSYILREGIRRNAELIDEKLDNIRVCDPAIGSGAFPVGLMTEIVRARKTLTTYLPDKGERTNYNFKRHAIQNCLYGVDIDPGAVEIAKLRLWLSLVVDEEDIKQIQPLPNLDYKIVCGNSLLSVPRDMFNNELFQRLEELKPLHFDETNAKKKQSYKSEIDSLISKITDGNKNFDFEVYFSEVFHEKGGFDVVIANPPYVDYRYIPKDTLKCLSNFYVYYPSARPNIYMFFIERSYRILKTNGILTYINPNQFLSIDAGYALRKMLINNTTIQFFVDVSYIKVFSEASTYSLVWSFLKRTADDYTIRINRCSDLNMLSATTLAISKADISADKDLRVTIVKNRALLSKVEYSHCKLGQLCKMAWGTSRSGYGKLKIKETQYFRLSEKGRKMYQPILQTSDIKRFYIDWQREFIPVSIYSENIKRVFEQEKLLIGRVTKRLQSSIDNKQRYVGKAAIIFGSTISLELILSLLNSELINYWYCSRFETTHMAGGYIRFDIPYLSQIPIPKCVIDNPNQQTRFIDVVDKILAITKDKNYPADPNKQAKVKEYERQIDQMVYELYGLTPEEIEIVEGGRK